MLGGFLLADDVLIVPVRLAPDDRGGSSVEAAYVFRFADGMIVSLTEYRTVEDAVRGARLAG
jgi:hypothetical protein